MFCGKCGKEIKEGNLFCTGCGAKVETETLVSSPTIGRIIRFGDYDWRVLDVQNKSVLIITVNIIEERAYHTKDEGITWGSCELREYLNENFFSRFKADDKNRIRRILNPNPNNPWYGTNGGIDTHDNVFLLSLDEVCRYFGDSSINLWKQPKNDGSVDYWKEEDAFWISDENNCNRISYYNGRATQWWLRSPAADAGCVASVGEDGIIWVDSSCIDNHFGIRPVLWLCT